jgi:sugar-specific transcriptional regulator TrmB
MESILTNLGFSVGESKVYFSLLNSGETSAGNIAKNTGLSRVAVYDCLRNLIREGLVLETLKKTNKLFKASNPKKIQLILEEKKEQIKEDELELKKLDNLFEQVSSSNETRIYRGFNGIKLFYEDCLREAEGTWLVLGVPKRAELLGGFLNDFSSRRAKKGIKLKIIYNKNAQELINARKKQLLSEVRILPDDYLTPASIDVIGDNLGIIIYSAEPLIFFIKNKEVADSFRKYFNIIWNKSKES